MPDGRFLTAVEAQLLRRAGPAEVCADSLPLLTMAYQRFFTLKGVAPKAKALNGVRKSVCREPEPALLRARRAAPVPQAVLNLDAVFDYDIYSR